MFLGSDGSLGRPRTYVNCYRWWDLEALTLSQRQRLNNFIERRWFEIGQPPLLRQHKYSILLRTIRREKRLVAMELIDLMLRDASSRLGSM